MLIPQASSRKAVQSFSLSENCVNVLEFWVFARLNNSIVSGRGMGPGIQHTSAIQPGLLLPGWVKCRGWLMDTCCKLSFLLWCLVQRPFVVNGISLMLQNYRNAENRESQKSFVTALQNCQHHSVSIRESQCVPNRSPRISEIRTGLPNRTSTDGTELPNAWHSWILQYFLSCTVTHLTSKIQPHTQAKNIPL